MEVHEIVSFAIREGLPAVQRKVKRPRIHSVISEVRPDASGEPASWLWVVLDDPPKSEMTEDRRNKVREALVELLQGQFGIMMPVYFFFQTKSDRARAGFPS
jgi:hypothetical protein